MDIVRALLWIAKPDKGESKPQILLCSDGKTYVVKFQNHNRHGKRVLLNDLLGYRIAKFLGVPVQKAKRALVNELLGYQIAKFLGVPVQKAKIIDVSASLMKSIPELSQFLKNGSMPDGSGLQFGSSYVKSTEISFTSWKDVTNIYLVPTTAAFDFLVLNSDRRDAHILKVGDGNHGYQFISVDHGHIFPRAPNWTIESLKNQESNPSPSMGYWKKVCQSTHIDCGFDQAIENLEELGESHLKQWINEVPEEWDLKTEEGDAVLNFLLKRKQKVKEEINQLLDNIEEG